MSTLINTFAPFDDALKTAFEGNLLAALLEDVGSGDLTGLLVPDDGRATALFLTDEGVATAARIGSALSFAEDAAAALPAAQQTELLTGLFKLIAQLQKTERFPEMRACLSCQYFEANRQPGQAHTLLAALQQLKDLGLRRIQVFGRGELPHTGAHHTGDASDRGDDTRGDIRRILPRLVWFGVHAVHYTQGFQFNKDS